MIDYFITPFVTYSFMRNALFSCLLISVAAAPLGVFLILRRMSLMGEALSHGILPGIAIAFLVAGLSLVSMTLGGVAMGLLIAYLSRSISKGTILHEDASFSALYIISLALGVFLISVKGGAINLMHLLFGGVLAVSNNVLLYILVISVVSILLLSIFYRPLVYDCFDPLFASTNGIPVSMIQIIFIVLIVLNLVGACQALGTLMALGIMMVPAITSRLLFHDLKAIIVASVLISGLSCYFGLVFSYHENVPSGPTIILMAGLFYSLAVLCRTVLFPVKLSYKK